MAYYLTVGQYSRPWCEYRDFLNYDLLELEIRDSYKKPYCDYVSFRFLRLCFRVLLFLQYSSFVISLHGACFSNKVLWCA